LDLAALSGTLLLTKAKQTTKRGASAAYLAAN
jgi:hypothetical protein